jgi:hypothetical protein
MKTLLAILMFSFVVLAQVPASIMPCAPAKGWECMCWQPGSGYGSAEAHIPLTQAEAERWRKQSEKEWAVWRETEKLRAELIAAHGLGENKACGEHLYIRSNEEFIFDSVPDNPGAFPAECGPFLRQKLKGPLWRADGRPFQGRDK